MALARKSKKEFHHRIYFIIACVLVIFFGISLGREWYRNYLVKKEIGELEAEAARLESKKLELTDLSRQFESSDFIERTARLEFGLQRPGENVVVVRRPDEGQNNQNAPTDKRNPELWLDYFLGRNPDS